MLRKIRIDKGGAGQNRRCLSGIFERERLQEIIAGAFTCRGAVILRFRCKNSFKGFHGSFRSTFICRPRDRDAVVVRDSAGCLIGNVPDQPRIIFYADGYFSDKDTWAVSGLSKNAPDKCFSTIPIGGSARRHDGQQSFDRLSSKDSFIGCIGSDGIADFLSGSGFEAQSRCGGSPLAFVSQSLRRIPEVHIGHRMSDVRNFLARRVGGGVNRAGDDQRRRGVPIRPDFWNRGGCCLKRLERTGGDFLRC